MRCPGQDPRFWTFKAIFEAECPECGYGIEFFRDDFARRCAGCGTTVVNPKRDAGCADHCRQAEQCAAQGGRAAVRTPGTGDGTIECGAASEISGSPTGRDRMKKTRKIIDINEDLCNGCGQCIINCAEGALQIVDGKARLVSEVYCDGLGACLGHCPTDAIRIIEREADDFDEEAVEEHLKHMGKTAHAPAAEPVASACPSARVMSFPSPCAMANRPVYTPEGGSALSHWPVQIKLVPPTAPFLKGADLLVAADCVPVAYARFHTDFLKDRAVMIGCPKFDNVQEYVMKFANIFSTADIRSVTVVDMEVPCCSKLPLIVKKGLELSGRQVPVEEVVISTRGELLKRQQI